MPSIHEGNGIIGTRRDDRRHSEPCPKVRHNEGGGISPLEWKAYLHLEVQKKKNPLEQRIKKSTFGEHIIKK
jgi:hypothetical protein